MPLPKMEFTTNQKFYNPYLGSLEALLLPNLLHSRYHCAQRLSFESFALNLKVKVSSKMRDAFGDRLRHGITLLSSSCFDGNSEYGPYADGEQHWIVKS